MANYTLSAAHGTFTVVGEPVNETEKTTYIQMHKLIAVLNTAELLAIY